MNSPKTRSLRAFLGRLLRPARLAAIGLALVTGGFSHVAVGQEIPTESDLKRAEQRKPNYSPYPDQMKNLNLLWHGLPTMPNL